MSTCECGTEILRCSQRCWSCGRPVGSFELSGGQLVWRSRPAGNAWSFAAVSAGKPVSIDRLEPLEPGRLRLVLGDRAERTLHVQRLIEGAGDFDEVLDG